MAHYDVRIADLFYAQAESEEQKKESTKRFYYRSLLLTHGLDILSSLILILVSCKFFFFSRVSRRGKRAFTLLIWVYF